MRFRRGGGLFAKILYVVFVDEEVRFVLPREADKGSVVVFNRSRELLVVAKTNEHRDAVFREMLQVLCFLESALAGTSRGGGLPRGEPAACLSS
jgi:hypothetical protein